ncbi:trace amine-associated receptor 3-like [Mixophyes fleayi]|uniref:trace amine-associated receptor 3-like n=1 Tax=Mixophyes fleayi TaxID=3061075 RepID=UPI003F4D8569
MDIINPNCSQIENVSYTCSSNQHLGARLGLYMFFTCSITITIFGNLCIIISISHFRQLSSPTNYLLLSLATTDLCLGLFIMPYSMVRTVESCWHFGNLFCKIHYSFDLSLSIISIFHLCMIAIDRFYAVCEPLYYRVKITMFVVKRLILFCWSIPMIFSLGVVASNSHVSGIEGYEILVKCFYVCPITFNKLWSMVIFFTCFFTPGSLMVGIYVKIFLVSERHAKFLENAVRDVTEISCKISKKKERKAAKKLAILMSVFLSCWLPLFVIFLIDPFINFSTPKIMFEVFNWFSYINSTCNPILYGFLYPWFRKSLKHIICGRICDPLSHTNLFSDE